MPQSILAILINGSPVGIGQTCDLIRDVVKLDVPQVSILSPPSLLRNQDESTYRTYGVFGEMFSQGDENDPQLDEVAEKIAKSLRKRCPKDARFVVTVNDIIGPGATFDDEW